jgi:hypothetical protein
MTRTSTFLAVSFVALLLVLAGCSTQQAPPSATPTPTATPPAPPPTAGGNPHCVGDGPQSEKCKLTTDDVASETGSEHDCGPQFSLEKAIHIKKDWVAGPGKFKQIRVVKGAGHTKDFEITIEACPGSPANPFPNATNPQKKDWNSGDLATSVPAGSRYRLIMKEKTKKGSMESDPHIVIDQGP